MQQSNIPLISIIGPTASGKTSVAAQLAYTLEGEIISADSRQVYKDMDIGTGKDLEDYIVQQKNIPYHLIDIANPGEKYDVYRYKRDVLKVLPNIKKPILCGGSGMYIESVTKNYDLPTVPINCKRRAVLEQWSHEKLKSHLASLKATHNQSDNDTIERTIRAIEIAEFDGDTEIPDFRILPIFIGIGCDRQKQRTRITHRLDHRLKTGMIEEVEQLLKTIPSKDLIYYGLEYKFITLYILGELTFEAMRSHLETAIHQFAKRQMTWFRRMEKKGDKIYWIDGEQSMNIKQELILNYLTEIDYRNLSRT